MSELIEAIQGTIQSTFAMTLLVLAGVGLFTLAVAVVYPVVHFLRTKAGQ